MISRRIALVIAALTMGAGVLLIVDRGGLIAWAGLIIGGVLFLKNYFRPSAWDLSLSLGMGAALIAAWVGTFYYVISTWESGEVVELTIDIREGTHTARLWVLDMEATPLVYYDADPVEADFLLAGEPVEFSRGGQVSTRIPVATRIEDLAEDEGHKILQAMQAKYGERNSAAVVYYLLLGQPRDRVSLVARLIEADR